MWNFKYYQQKQKKRHIKGKMVIPESSKSDDESIE